MNAIYRNCQPVAAAMTAIVILGLSGLTLDQGHTSGLPRGVVEVGELQTLRVGSLAVAVLPEVEVIGSRNLVLAGSEAIDADGPRS